MQPSSQLREEREAKRAEDNAIDEKWEAGHATIKGKKRGHIKDRVVVQGCHLPLNSAPPPSF